MARNISLAWVAQSCCFLGVIQFGIICLVTIISVNERGSVYILCEHLCLIAGGGAIFSPRPNGRLCLRTNNWSEQIIHNEVFYLKIFSTFLMNCLKIDSTWFQWSCVKLFWTFFSFPVPQVVLRSLWHVWAWGGLGLEAGGVQREWQAEKEVFYSDEHSQTTKTKTQLQLFFGTCNSHHVQPNSCRETWWEQPPMEAARSWSLPLLPKSCLGLFSSQLHGEQNLCRPWSLHTGEMAYCDFLRWWTHTQAESLSSCPALAKCTYWKGKEKKMIEFPCDFFPPDFSADFLFLEGTELMVNEKLQMPSPKCVQ